MSDPKNNGKTLWEMLKDKLNKPAQIVFYNPLKLAINATVPIAEKDPEFANYDFSVQEIREYTRHMGDQEFRFTDYVLSGVNTKTFDNDDRLVLRLRAVPNPAQTQDLILLRLDDEFAFDPAFLEVVKDPSGVFNVDDDGSSGPSRSYSRINEVKDPYEPVILTVSATTPEGLAVPSKSQASKLQYWDFWRDAEIAQTDKARKEFLFVEMNSETGWFQIWTGHEFFL